MIDYDNLVSLMKGYGYTEISRSNYGDGIYSVDFIPKYKQEPRYTVTVILGTESFSFFYLVPKSLCKLELGPLSPVSNKKHFESMEAQFVSRVYVLESAFGNLELCAISEEALNEA